MEHATWPKIESAVAALAPRLLDDFSRVVLDGALKVARDDSNPLRGNLFASAMREVMTHTFHTAGPDAEVTQCAWYKPEADKPTRRQRLSYWTRGGLSDGFVEEELGLDPKGMADEILAGFNQLHKATHVRENTIVAAEDEVLALVGNSLDALAEAFDLALECRESVVEALASEIQDEVTAAFISDTIGEIDELATHHWIEESSVDEVEVTSLTSSEVRYEISGTLGVTLQWGSGSDVRDDIGAVGQDSFPFVITLTAKPSAPHAFEGGAPYSVDTSKWFGETADTPEPATEEPWT
jgi:hypothetical protein